MYFHSMKINDWWCANNQFIITMYNQSLIKTFKGCDVQFNSMMLANKHVKNLCIVYIMVSKENLIN